MLFEPKEGALYLLPSGSQMGASTRRISQDLHKFQGEPAKPKLPDLISCCGFFPQGGRKGQLCVLGTLGQAHSLLLVSL